MSDALCDINVRGRLEVISSDKGFMVIIDYAHNELSLRELLMAMRQYVRGKAYNRIWMRRQPFA